MFIILVCSVGKASAVFTIYTQSSRKSNLRAFLSLREAKGTDEATSLVTLFAELRLGEGLTFNSATTKQLQELNNLTIKIISKM